MLFDLKIHRTVNRKSTEWYNMHKSLKLQTTALGHRDQERSVALCMFFWQVPITMVQKLSQPIGNSPSFLLISPQSLFSLYPLIAPLFFLLSSLAIVIAHLFLTVRLPLFHITRKPISLKSILLGCTSNASHFSHRNLRLTCSTIFPPSLYPKCCSLNYLLVISKPEQMKDFSLLAWKKPTKKCG